MAEINFNIEQVGDCQTMLCRYAEIMGEQAEKIHTMINSVGSQWKGAGASEYIEYLEKMKSDINTRSQKLRELSENLGAAKQMAIEADKMAAGGSGEAQSGTDSSRPSLAGIGAAAWNATMDQIKNSFNAAK